MSRPLMHYYTPTTCKLRTLCGEWMPVYTWKAGKLKPSYTSYKNRLTCSKCKSELNKLKL